MVNIIRKDGNYYELDAKGRAWLWSRKQVEQALRDAKLCKCGTCACCVIKKLSKKSA